MNYRILLLLVFLAVTAACATERLRTDGEEDFRRAMSYFPYEIMANEMFDNDGTKGILVSATFYYRNLPFVQQNDELVANAQFQIAIFGRFGESQRIIEEAVQPFRVRLSDPRHAESLRSHSIDFFIPVEIDTADYFLVESVLAAQDGTRLGARAVRAVQGTTTEHVSLSSVLLSFHLPGSGSRSRFASSMRVPSGSDSLHFEVSIRNPRGKQLEIRSELSRIESDLRPADFLGGPGMRGRSIQQRGVRFASAEVVQSQTSPLGQETLVSFRSTQIMPEHGFYRYTVALIDENGEVKATVYRDFSVVAQHFPAITSVIEMARPLIYLMTENEHRQLMRIQDPDSMRMAIDRFWLENVRDSRRAVEVIQLYYSRVELANLKFSNFKEGWKTDMGKVYILFGPPWYVDARINSETWIYGYNRNDPRYVYVFERPTVRSSNFPFDHFILLRRRIYQEMEFQRIRDWLTGDVLYRSI